MTNEGFVDDQWGVCRRHLDVTDWISSLRGPNDCNPPGEASAIGSCALLTRCAALTSRGQSYNGHNRKRWNVSSAKYFYPPTKLGLHSSVQAVVCDKAWAMLARGCFFSFFSFPFFLIQEIQRWISILRFVSNLERQKTRCTHNLNRLLSGLRKDYIQ